MSMLTQLLERSRDLMLAGETLVGALDKAEDELAVQYRQSQLPFLWSASDQIRTCLDHNPWCENVLDQVDHMLDRARKGYVV
jgi:hypothetical protein